ncbi:hypothetical protein CPC08DRAFT_708124 [Agrocybe pediades]|nr:hypothetical protein CPC08DRAFT_708124 [Agrocybe pediades]
MFEVKLIIIFHLPQWVTRLRAMSLIHRSHDRGIPFTQPPPRTHTRSDWIVTSFPVKVLLLPLAILAIVGVTAMILHFSPKKPSG